MPYMPLVTWIFLNVLSVLIAGAMSWQQWENLMMLTPLKCPVYSVLGVKCSFCGMTHAVISFFKGEWWKAYQYNPLVFIGYAVVALAVFYWTHKKKLVVPQNLVSTKIVYAVLLGLLIFMLVRNVNSYLG